jgi:hypothetical protein
MRARVAQLALHCGLEALSLTEDERMRVRTLAAEWALAEGDLARAVATTTMLRRRAR